MKRVFGFLKGSLWVAVGLSIVGCQGPVPKGASKGPRFREANEANVVLRFNSWDYIFMVQPEDREEGFLRPLKRNEVAQAIRALNTPHELAVVTIGWFYKAEDQARLVTEWKSILLNCGFRRVVILRPNDNKLNGSIIVEDSRISTGI